MLDVDSLRTEIDDLTFMETREALKKTAKGRKAKEKAAGREGGGGGGRGREGRV